jgi:hypothetical protein
MPVEDRLADTWEPMVAVADLAGGQWPALARDAIVTLDAGRDSATELSLRVRLLVDVREAFGPAPALPSGILVERLRGDAEAPWADLSGTGLTVRRLANMLRDYDIAPANRRWADGTQSKGYARADFEDAWTRYCPPERTEPHGQAAPGEPSQASQPSPRRPARDGRRPWDGSSVPMSATVPGPTSAGTVGTDGTLAGRAATDVHAPTTRRPQEEARR